MVALRPDTQKLVLERRKSDTSWGWAFAHLIPLVGFYHAWTRRTITPIGLYLGICLVAGFTFGLSDTYDNMNEKERDAVTEAAALLIMVPAVKYGIHLDNKRALDDKF